MATRELNPILRRAMKTYSDMLSILMELREDQVKEMLEFELDSTYPRPSVIERLHQRYTILRSARERKEMLEGMENVKGRRPAEATDD